jgi:hypothetical protein
MRTATFILLFWLLGIAGSAVAAEPGRVASVLPQAFGGWQITKPQTSTSPESADPTNAALLKEYGFTDFEGATYTRDDGRKLTIKAARFQDASGAYGAFTFYKMQQMLNEKIGDQGASLNERVLFYKGNILVDAVFQRLSAMSAAELRELADDLPRPTGPIASLPGLPIYLPKQSYVKNTAKYVVGPIGLQAVSAPLQPQYIDFSKGAEVVLGNYDFSGNEATLMLISYPTPQIAAAQLKTIDSAQKAHQFGDVQLVTKRTGPILVVAAGNISEGDAKSLLSQVNYDADVTWNENTYHTRRDNAANLIFNVVLLAVIVSGLGLVAGIAFGGFRVMMKRIFPGNVFDRPEQTEIIALHLSEAEEKASSTGVSPSINAS